MSPSLRGRGLKFRLLFSVDRIFYNVALFTRAWIEIDSRCNHRKCDRVALFTRAWIEIKIPCVQKQ